MKKLSEFTFAVLCYNHSDYILTHLESIKYQISNHGEGRKCNLIITDDNSKDDSLSKIEKWISFNQEIFNSIQIFKNETNYGTCYCTKTILENLNSKYFKLTAGDDFYTSNNIFKFIETEPEFDLLSGLPLRLQDEKIYISKFEIINYLISDQIYKRTLLIDRLSNISIINAPNLFYSVQLAKNFKINSILNNFDVTEDLPLQISIARHEPLAKLISKHTPIVIYRRTNQSTYLVANERFNKDQIMAFNLLLQIQKEKRNNLLYALLLIRKLLFKINNRFLKIFANPAYYIYVLKSIFYLPTIFRALSKLEYSISDQQTHFDKLKEAIKHY